jgi:isopropanol dehydrogenase (NADP+)
MTITKLEITCYSKPNGCFMKAFVMKEIGSVAFMEKPIPKAGPYDVIVKTTSALVCTSDSRTVRGAIGPRTNITLGHEAVGTVYQVGTHVKLFKQGDRVAVGAITPDWGDIASQAGYPSQSGQPLGGWKFSNTKDGVFAEYFHVNEGDANMAKIPDEVPDETAVYVCDMMSTGFAGAEAADIPMGGAAVVFALGPVGLMATAGAKFRGAGMIIGVDSIPKRRELSKFYGADLIIDPSKEDAVSQIMDITGGIGADSSIEAVGSEITFQNAIRVTKAGGTISNIGYHGSGECVCIPRLA